MKNSVKRPEDFAGNSPLRKPIYFKHFSTNSHKYAELISFFRMFPDLFYDYLSMQHGKQLFFFCDYQRVILRAMARFQRPYFCIPRGAAKCVTGDTYISTPKGRMKIEDIIKNNGIEILKDKETAQKNEVEIINRYGQKENTDYILSNGEQDVIQIVSHCGYEIKCTKNHPLLVVSNDGSLIWKKAKDITNEDYICIDRTNNVFTTDYIDLKEQKDNILVGLNKQQTHAFYEYEREFPQYLDEDFALFIGYLIGDGHMGTGNVVGFTNIDEDILFNYFRIAKKYKLKIIQNKNDRITYEFYSAYFKRFLELCDVSCVKAQYKHIPKYIFQSPKSVQKAFIQGLFDTDGWVLKDKAEVGFDSSSKQLVKEMQLLLLNFGIVSRIRQTYSKKFKTYSWKLCIGSGNARIYRDEIGFTCKRKMDTLEKSIQNTSCINTNIDIIPNQENNLDWENIHGIVREKIRDIHNKKKRMTYYTRDMVKDHVINKDILDVNYFYDKVEETNELGKMQVYDVSVPNTHSFIGNGIINHNTLLDVMYLYHTAIFYPGSKLGITSGTKEQIVSMWKEKHQEILRFFPAIKKEIIWEGTDKPQFSKDTARVSFRNGSWIQSTPVIQATKGGRRSRLSKEESALIIRSEYNDIVSPMLQGADRLPIGAMMADPEELNGQEMSMTTSG